MIRNADKLTDDDCGACGYGVLEVGYVANAKTIGGEKTILRLGVRLACGRVGKARVQFVCDIGNGAN